MQDIRFIFFDKMMQAATLLAFVAVLFSIGHSEDVIATPAKMCRVISVTCPCGEKQTTFTVTLEMCSLGNLSLESDIHRFRVRRFCSKFANCETCSPDVQKCISCPEGMHGKFCNKSDAARKKTGHLVFKRGLCAVPSHMDTGTHRCEKKNSKLICQLQCDEDYSFPEGKNRTLTCDLKNGIWRPHPFNECNFTKFNACKKNALEKEGKKGGRKKREKTACERSNGRRRRDTNSMCEMPTGMKFSKIECGERGKEIVCEQTCKVGYQHSDGSMKKSINCNVVTGLWKPQNFEECIEMNEKKVSLCAVPSHMETNIFKCNESRGLLVCNQICNNGHTFEEGPKRTITCKTHLGLWKPHNFQECKQMKIKKRSLCAVPSFMETNTYKCNESSRMITCHQTCNDGYTFREGPERTIKCKTYTGLWKPHDFQQCHKMKIKKRSLCAVPSFMETNTFKCNESSRMITCHQTCNDGYTFREGTERTIKCNTYTGLWRPHNFQQCDKVQ